jgi:hypothetical protein
MLKIQSTTSFSRVVKKMHDKDKRLVDEAVEAISSDLASGEEKNGDLSGVFVYRFKMNKQNVLLAYKYEVSKFNPEEIILLAIGSRENFYEYLKNEVHA